MEIIICRDAQRVGEVAATKAARIAADVGPGIVLGVATGSSPVHAFAEMAKLVASGELDLSEASAFALDEYVGIPYGHPQSYHDVIHKDFVDRVDFAEGAVRGPDGLATDIPAFCAAYEDAIVAAGGVDLQILGIGTVGHIGFNEPGSSLASRTRIKTLARRSREDNARFFDSLDEVPRHCLTQGIGTIMDARNVILVATGEGKAHAIAQVIEGPVTALFPGSVLQLHPHVTVIIDEAAASELALVDYYKETYATLPDWQRLEI
jgi:glucosamine-6-phosphate deaminase